MSALRALAWTEWVRVRRDTWVFAALGLACVISCRLVVAMTGDDAWNVAILGCLAFFVLPCAGILLGATTTAGDEALSFAGARPTSATARVVTRLGVRIVALGIVAAASGIAAVAVLGPQITSTVVRWAPRQGMGFVFVVLGAWLLCCVGFAALASAFASRPLAAALAGAIASAALLFELVLPMLVFPGVDLWGFVPVLARALVVVSVLGAAATATAKRSSKHPLGPRAAAAVVAAGLVPPAVLLSAWMLLGGPVTRHHAARVQGEWEVRMPALSTVAARHPAQEANAIALELESAITPLGISLVPPHRRGGGADSYFEQERRAARVGEWVNRQLHAPSSVIDSPPPDVVTLLEAGDVALGHVRTLLLGAEAPRWEVADAHRSSLRQPNYHGHGLVVERLCGSALSNVVSGRTDAAVHDLDAAWRLVESLLGRPEVASATHGVLLATRVAGSLRKLPEIPPAWEPRLDAATFRGALVDALLIAAAGDFVRATDDDSQSLPPGNLLAHRLWDPAIQSRYAAMGRYHAGLAEALGGTRRCGADLPELDLDDWSAERTMRDLERLVAQFELTRKVAQIQRLRAADPIGAWPASVPGIEESSCKDLRWRYTAGTSFSLVSEGPAVAWLEGGLEEPALSYTSP